jgi:hypothetical protein
MLVLEADTVCDDDDDEETVEEPVLVEVLATNGEVVDDAADDGALIVLLADDDEGANAANDVGIDANDSDEFAPKPLLLADDIVPNVPNAPNPPLLLLLDDTEVTTDDGGPAVAPLVAPTEPNEVLVLLAKEPHDDVDIEPNPADVDDPNNDDVDVDVDPPNEPNDPNDEALGANDDVVLLVLPNGVDDEPNPPNDDVVPVEVNEKGDDDEDDEADTGKGKLAVVVVVEVGGVIVVVDARPVVVVMGVDTDADDDAEVGAEATGGTSTTVSNNERIVGAPNVNGHSDNGGNDCVPVFETVAVNDNGVAVHVGVLIALVNVSNAPLNVNDVRIRRHHDSLRLPNV